jgi:hypothetical protein
MLLFAKFAAILVVIWFFLSAREQGEQPIKWALIGLVGYWLTWWAVKLTVVSALVGMVGKNATGMFLLIQIPAVCAILAAILIRKKLLADIPEK